MIGIKNKMKRLIIRETGFEAGSPLGGNAGNGECGAPASFKPWSVSNE